MRIGLSYTAAYTEHSSWHLSNKNLYMLYEGANKQANKWKEATVLGFTLLLKKSGGLESGGVLFHSRSITYLLHEMLIEIYNKCIKWSMS